MVKEDYNDYIFEYKKGLQTIKAIYNDLCKLYLIAEPESNLEKIIKKPEEIKEIVDKGVKIRYMVIALICSNLEGLLANIRTCFENDRQKRKSLSKDFLIKNNALLGQIFLIRHCVMHTYGNIVKPCSRETSCIDRKYKNKEETKINLFDTDIKDFFLLFENEIIEKIRNMVN